MEEEPICEFPKFKKALIEKGYKIAKAIPWRKIDSEDVKLSEGKLDNDKLDIREDGIFQRDSEGIKRQVFLYKKEMYLKYEGKEQKPKYHVCKCDKIQEYLKDGNIVGYRSANTETVRVLNKSNNNKETVVSNLSICGYCARILREYKDMDSTEFSRMLSSANSVLSTRTEVDIYGYTKDWQKISAEFRKRHNYICEKCGVKVSPLDHAFVEVHHKNKDKTDNRDSNLQCLCIKCHSEIDATHIHNFSTKGQQLLIKLFLERYGNRTD